MNSLPQAKGLKYIVPCIVTWPAFPLCQKPFISRYKAWGINSSSMNGIGPVIQGVSPWTIHERKGFGCNERETLHTLCLFQAHGKLTGVYLFNFVILFFYKNCKSVQFYLKLLTTNVS